MRVVCVGAGYVGGPTMAVLAANCPHVDVHVVDLNAALIEAWNSDALPIFEPGLESVVAKTRGVNLFFSTQVEELVADADIVFVAVNTPTKGYGVGEGRAAEVKNIERVARMLAANFKSGFRVVVEKSTVPVRTSETMHKIFSSNESSGGAHVEVLSNPEFLAEGTAINDLQRPDRVLIGGRETPEGEKAVNMLRSVYENWVPTEKIITTNLWSSEMSKLVANAFLAQRVSSINSVSAICEAMGADVVEVGRAIGSDSRIGSRFLQASVGFGGSCFQKDILNLVYLCHTQGLPEVAEYWEQVLKINNFQKKRFAKSVVRSLFDSLDGKRIAVLGFAFKKDTGDTRESAAIYVCADMLAEHAQLAVYDPKVPREQVIRNLSEPGLVPSDVSVERSVEVCANAYDACKGAHAVLILTEWDEFVSLDYARIYEGMVKPAFVFQGRCLVEPKRLNEIGFHVYTVGKPSNDPMLQVITGNVNADSHR